MIKMNTKKTSFNREGINDYKAYLIRTMPIKSPKQEFPGKPFYIEGRLAGYKKDKNNDSQ